MTALGDQQQREQAGLLATRVAISVEHHLKREREVGSLSRYVSVSRFAGLKSRADHLHSMAAGLFPRGAQIKSTFVTLLVPPVTQAGGLKMRGEFVEDVVFSEMAQVVWAAAGPAAMGADEAGVDAMDLGGGELPTSSQ